MSCNQNLDLCIASGDDLRIVVEVYDQNNQLVDLTGVTSIEWALASNVNTAALITKSLGAEISINTPTSFVFDMIPADTAALNGSYYHEAEIVNSSGKTYTVMSGRFTIKPTLI